MRRKGDRPSVRRFDANPRLPGARVVDGGHRPRPSRYRDPMSVLWETDRNGTHYSVRAHGASVRLYSNRVFHSQWNPDRPFAGGVWDCLGLPVLYRPVARVRRVLLLGVGGGAVIRQLERLVPGASVTGIEIDPVHLDVARRWFGVRDGAGPRARTGEAAETVEAGGPRVPLDGGAELVAGGGDEASARVTLVEGDAIAWLRRHAGEPFDVVVDDLFGHDRGEPLRAQPLTPDWIAALRHAATPDGLVVVNCADGKELRTAAPAFADEGFAHGRRWSQGGYENAIGVFSTAPLVPRDWSRRLEGLGLDAAAQRRARAIVRRPMRG